MTDHRNFQSHSALAVALRRMDVWPFFAVYGAAFLLALWVSPPAAFDLPVFKHVPEIASAASWAFLASYPVMHLLMASRKLIGYRSAIAKLKTASMGAAVLCGFAWFISLAPPNEPSGKAAFLASSIGTSLILAMLSMSAAFCLFLVLEPLRECIARGR